MQFATQSVICYAIANASSKNQIGIFDKKKIFHNKEEKDYLSKIVLAYVFSK